MHAKRISRRMPALLLLLINVVVIVAQPQTPENKPVRKPLPPVQWARSRAIDVQHVAIELRFDWKKRQAYGAAAVTLAPFQRASKIALDAARLTIHAVTLANGKPLRHAYDGGDGNDNLEITLDRAYEPGEALTVRVEYRTNWVNPTDPNNLWGSYGKGLRFFEPTATEPKKRRQIWSMGTPESNRYWFPGYDAPNDLRTTEFIATVEEKLTAISNGRLVRVRNNGDGTRTFHWKADTPYANHRTSFVVGEYVDVKQAHDGVEIHNFGYPDETEAVAASVERLPDMIRFHSEATGVKYPYPSYTQAFVQEFPWGGGHNLGVSTVTDNMIDDAPTHADYLYLWDGVEAQEIAAQWFGNLLPCRDWGHIWLSESFARYFDGMYSEHKNGREEFLIWSHLFNHNTYLADWNAGVRRPIVTRHYESAEAIVRDNYSSLRGAAVLHMLRKHLGEEKWRKAIQRYVRANANSLVTTEDFRIAIEEATGESMEWFFDQWLYRMGHPIFVVTKSYDEAQKQLTLTVRQTQKIDPNDDYPQVEWFQGRVEIEIDDRIERVQLAPKAENVFTFASPQAPKLVNFDYESAWIKEIVFEKSVDELLHQLRNDRDVLGKNWAMGELVKRARDEKRSADEKAKIHDGLRGAMRGKVYWRSRYAAIIQLQNLLAPATETRPVALDEATIATLLAIIKEEKSWMRAAAINFLGMTRDPKYAPVYLDAMNERSHPVINGAANALGKSGAPGAFEALTKLMTVPSWKGENRISGMNGLKELGDPRGAAIALDALADLHSPHWTLATPIWDYRLTAAQTIAALGKSDAAFPMVFGRFKTSLDENDLNDIFSNLLLLTTLADPRGLEAFDLLKAKFKTDATMMQTIGNLEAPFRKAIAKPPDGVRN